MMFACFSAAAVADEAEAEARRHRGGGGGDGRRRSRGAASFVRRKFFGGRKGRKEYSKSKEASSAALAGRDVDGVYGVVVVGAASASSSSAALSPALSLDSACSLSSSSSSSTTTTACCSGSRSSFSDALPPARRSEERRRTTTTAAGPAAVILCMVMVMLCGRVGATVLASAAFYLFPRLLPVSANEADSAVASPESDLPPATEQKTMKSRVVKEGFFVRNRKK
ncbi:uncharacterized protein LOC107304557 [Oryza brachyantha]|uniref:uncharacterized protein LOC107304557 n=1 Tax=Oryza brachyantha TaxID=4533 RepID=UPI001ADD382B|nr:uncharacterized protein LOC107304557 [Oryza brachyantha]